MAELVESASPKAVLFNSGGFAETFGPGLLALSAVSAVLACAAIGLMVTSIIGFPWPLALLQSVAIVCASFIALSQLADLSTRRMLFAFGIMLGTAPSLVHIAARFDTAHWDDFMTWLPNARYIWLFGSLPTHELPSISSTWPGYPPASSLLIASVWSVAGRVIEQTGAYLNLGCLVLLAGLLARVLAFQALRPRDQWFAGLTLGLLATTLNPVLDWHWVLSSLPDTATSVVLAACVMLAVDIFKQRSGQFDEARTIVLALTLTLVTGLKQTGIVLATLLVISLIIVRTSSSNDRAITVRETAAWAGLIWLPSFVLWLSWHFYSSYELPGGSFAFRPLAEWNFAAWPGIVGGIGREWLEHWPYFVPATLLLLTATRRIVRSWRALGGEPRRSDLYISIFAVMCAGYSSFLILVYLGAMSDDEARRAAEWFRYQGHLGSCALLAIAAVVSEAVSRLPRYTGYATVGAALAATILILPAPGIYPGRGVYGDAEIQQLREIGRSAGERIGRRGTPIDVRMLMRDGLLAAFIVRYEMWSTAPASIRAVDFRWADSIADFAKSLAVNPVATAPSITTVALQEENGSHCGFYIDAAGSGAADTLSDAERCETMLRHLRQ